MSTTPRGTDTGITNTGVAAPHTPRQWQIEWELPGWITLETLSSIMEHVTGYGRVWLEHEHGFPKVFHAEFVTTPEWNEFDMADALRDTAVTFDVYNITRGGPGGDDGFPVRPSEVFGS